MVVAVPRVTGIGGDGDSGAQFTWTSGGSTVFSIFAASSEYFGRPDQACMIGWAVDPEGNRFELWEPPSGE
jgi:hypothetical protein